ncbi:tyrosine-type recombinase/integrase [Zavarzinia sp.]|uniref:tyrosine-type recombinase/integrase n=1 Tax=Zavarzinia sp. TaxID=2027920 RepID=UPI0035682402
MREKITKTLVESIEPQAVDVFVFDTKLAGFTLKVTPRGCRVYQLRYRMGGGRSATKKTFTIGRHGQPWTAEQARKEAEVILAGVRRGVDPATEKQAVVAQRFTLDQLADRFMAEHVEVKTKPSTTKAYRYVVDTVVRPQLGQRNVAALTRSDIAGFHHGLKDTPYQANHALAILSKMLNLAEVWGYRPDGSNPCRHIERYRTRHRERFLATEEVKRLGEVLGRFERDEGAPDVVILGIQLLLLTGCRVGELLKLQWDDIDFEAGTFHFADSKTGAKTVTVGSVTIALLADRPRQGSAWVLAGYVNPRKPLPYSTLKAWWHKFREAADIADVRIHDARHTVGTYAGQAGANAFLIRDKLSHKTVAMTGRYVNPDHGPLRQLSDQVEGRVSAALQAGATGREGDVEPLSKAPKPANRRRT